MRILFLALSMAVSMLPLHAPASTHVDAGGRHACVIQLDGTPACWGADDRGQLGNGAPYDASAFPVNLSAANFGGKRLVQIAVGEEFTCALDEDGRAWCWGDNSSEQLGSGNAALDSPLPLAVDQPAGLQFTSLAAGGFHVCALSSDAHAWCWGEGSSGQLGQGADLADKGVPQLVGFPDGGDVVELSGGLDYTCARRAQGSVWCWGENADGQLGRGFAGAFDGLPQAIAMPEGLHAAALDAGDSHACILDASSNAWCWGYGNSGQLGNSGTATQPMPQAVAMPQDVRFTTIDAGQSHTCAIDQSRQGWCWGGDSTGQLGNDWSRRSTMVPSVVASLAFSDFVEITAGKGFSCGIYRTGPVLCWGSVGDGQLGIGSFGRSATPKQVFGAGWTQLTASGDHSCAVDGSQQLWCWGKNDDGQLGTDDIVDQSKPIRAAALAIEKVSAVDAGAQHTCAIDLEGFAWCWGRNTQMQAGGAATDDLEPHRVPSADGVPAAAFVTVSAGTYHSCAIDASGEIWCWGNDALGQLGDGLPNVSSGTPRHAHVANRTFKHVAAGRNFTCAIEAQLGALYCWGANGEGQLGLNDNAGRHVPTALPGADNSGWNFVAAGDNHACASRSVAGNSQTSDLYCWGANDRGQLGTGSLSPSLTPVKVAGVLGAGELLASGTIALGGSHSCVRSTYFGLPACWGENRRGQLVDGSTTGRRNPQGTLFDNAWQVATGGQHTCALQVDGTIACGGDAAHGQLGNGALGNRAVPVILPGQTAWTSSLFQDSFE